MVLKTVKNVLPIRTVLIRKVLVRMVLVRNVLIRMVLIRMVMSLTSVVIDRCYDTIWRGIGCNFDFL